MTDTEKLMMTNIIGNFIDDNIVFEVSKIGPVDPEIWANIATRWDPYIIWWDPYDSYPHDSDLFILFEVCNNSLKGSSYIIYPILYTLIYYPICAIIIIRAYILKLKFDFRFNQIAQGNVESPVRS